VLERLNSGWRRKKEGAEDDNSGGLERLKNIAATLERDAQKLKEKQEEIQEKMKQVADWQLLVQSKIEKAEDDTRSAKKPKIIKPMKSPTKK
jgi:hypothetical protein